MDLASPAVSGTSVYANGLSAKLGVKHNEELHDLCRSVTTVGTVKSKIARTLTQ